MHHEPRSLDGTSSAFPWRSGVTVREDVVTLPESRNPGLVRRVLLQIRRLSRFLYGLLTETP
jgi:hypothetical protein